MLKRSLKELRVIARDPLLLILIVVIMAALLIFVVIPVVRVLLVSFQLPGGGYGIDNYQLLAERRLYRNALRNSLMVGGLVGVIGVALGYVAAFSLTRTNVPFKRVLSTLMILPIVSPPFSGAISILFLFGFNGVVTKQILGLQNFSILSSTYVGSWQA